MTIEQGNVITSNQITHLHRGMTRGDVLFILGTPSIKDPFHSNRWDYFYSVLDDSKTMIFRQRLSLFFEDGQLTKVDSSRGQTKFNVSDINNQTNTSVTEDNILKHLWAQIRGTN